MSSLKLSHSYRQRLILGHATHTYSQRRVIGHVVSRGPHTSKRPQRVAVASSPTISTNPKNTELTPELWKSFLSAFKSEYNEYAFMISEDMVEGNIPEELEGTLLRNGPGLFEIGGVPIPQPFDGDGKAAMLCFPGRGQLPYFATRFVRTQAFVEEQRANRMLYRGAFSVGNPAGGFFYNPFDLSVKQVANTGIVAWDKNIYALYERDLPYELDSPELKTKGRTNLNGNIDEPYFAAHHRIMHEKDGSKRLIGFSSTEAGRDNKLVIWEFDEHGTQLYKTENILKNAAFGFFHDMAATENYYVFVENPITLNLMTFLTKYMFGRACIAECLEFNPSMDAKIHVFARPGKSGKVQHGVYACPRPFFTFHHANAFETEDGHLVLDTCALHEGADFSANFETGVEYYNDNRGRSALTRLHVDIRTGNVTEKVLVDRACDFPSVSPQCTGKPHQHMYVYGSVFDAPDKWGPPQVISKVSVDDVQASHPHATEKVYFPGENRWAGEPLFVPRKNGSSEDDGWVLVVVFDANTGLSDIVILNAQSMEPQATIKLPLCIPSGLHGSFTSDYLGPLLEEEKAQYRDKIMTYDIRHGVDRYTTK